MRIVVMSSLYPPHFVGGAELTCRDQVEGLRQRGHDVFVVTSWWGLAKPSVEGNVYRLLNVDSRSLCSCAGKSGPDLWRIRRRYDQLWQAVRLGKNYRIARSIVASVCPDVAYVWHMADVSISPVLAAQDLGIPIVFRLPSYWLANLQVELRLEPNPVKRWYRAAVIGMGGFGRLDTTHMLPNSMAVMQRYAQVGFSADTMQMVPDGLPRGLLPDREEVPALPVRARSGEVKLVFAGRLVAEKGPDVAIQALAHLLAESNGRQVTLDIIGEGPEEYEASLRDLVARLGLETRVLFLGKMDHPQLLQRFTQYDALLLASRWAEPFSRAMLEAMACGVPVVATNTGGTAEGIADRVNGMLVPPDSPSAMAQAITELLSNPELTQRIRHNALATLRARYSLERVVEQVEGCLQSAVLRKLETGGQPPTLQAPVSTTVAGSRPPFEGRAAGSHSPGQR